MGKEYKINFDDFRRIIDMVNVCMDSYLYILDLKRDVYYISPRAADRFRIPGSYFENGLEEHKNFVHPEDYEMLNKDLESMLRGEKSFHDLEYRWCGKDDEAIWINCKGQMFRDEEGNPEYLVGCINEIGENPKADNVSGLLRGISLESRLLEMGKKEFDGVVLRIGIDDFKEINENRGIEYGDMILRKTAEQIKSIISQEQMLYRIVADEFIITDLEQGTVEKAKQLYERICQAINEFISNNRYEVFYTVSGGILELSKVKDINYKKLMMLSEFALSEAKSKGKNNCYVFEPTDYEIFKNKKKITKILRHAVNHGFEGFEVYYQPIVDISDNKIGLAGAEALLRFRTEETGFIPPIQFIPFLEESGLIIPVGRWVMYQAMEACSRIQEKIPEFKVSVNISHIQVLKSNLLKEILLGVNHYGLKPGSITIELTESGLLESSEKFIQFYEGLKKHKIPLALDDFGTGYSNFRYLYDIGPSTLKIDRSFTVKALNSDYEYGLLKYMADMTHSIDLKFCIEGVETKEDLEKISRLNPDYIQGFFFGRPSPINIFINKYVEAD